MGLPCLNCQREVEQSEAKIFAECFICPDCYKIAERIYLQGQNELQHLLVTLKELIRLSIVQRRLSLAPPPESKPEDKSMKAVDFLLSMMRKEECQPTETSSSSSARPPAPTVGGSPSSISTQEEATASEPVSGETLATGSLDNA